MSKSCEALKFYRILKLQDIEILDYIELIMIDVKRMKLAYKISKEVKMRNLRVKKLVYNFCYTSVNCTNNITLKR